MQTAQGPWKNCDTAPTRRRTLALSEAVMRRRRRRSGSPNLAMIAARPLAPVLTGASPHDDTLGAGGKEEAWRIRIRVGSRRLQSAGRTKTDYGGDLSKLKGSPLRTRWRWALGTTASMAVIASAGLA